ncbi:hypothetical protein Ahy_B01g055941 [Arachis hypogaea]|uniref:phosphoribosylaminoimidazolesuccinocarboxamide synthase n=1 Tax=Arachis hypogaea TaxID=3818 RepID=A0A445AXL8_ARAHY|nr:hypothetical protein Ahy_B01g055941 [Arachis hypogaea]
MNGSRDFWLETYDNGEYLVLVTIVDRVLASIPFKGQVVNQTSLWWFERTQHITANAVVFTPDPNVIIAKKCSIFLLSLLIGACIHILSNDFNGYELAYMFGIGCGGGVIYNKGIQNYCGNVLPMVSSVKNQKLVENIFTPRTKVADHDVPVLPDEIIEWGLMTRADYEEVSRNALMASEHSLILVDTKYEFGKAEDGSIIYWVANSYLERFQNGLESENVDNALNHFESAQDKNWQSST